MLDLLVKEKLVKAIKGNNCQHIWFSVMAGRGNAVICKECGWLLCENVLKYQADKIAEIANYQSEVLYAEAETVQTA